MEWDKECYMICPFGSGELPGTDLEYCLADIDGFTTEVSGLAKRTVPADCPIDRSDVAPPWGFVQKTESSDPKLETGPK